MPTQCWTYWIRTRPFATASSVRLVLIIRVTTLRYGCSAQLWFLNGLQDLGRVGRPLKSIIIIDNSPASYMFHPENAVPIDSWFDDMNDTELLDLIPFLEDLTKVRIYSCLFVWADQIQVDDVCAVLDQHRG